jgi:hypothetical protein
MESETETRAPSNGAVMSVNDDKNGGASPAPVMRRPGPSERPMKPVPNSRRG